MFSLARVHGTVVITTGCRVHCQGGHVGNLQGLFHPLLLHGEQVPVLASDHGQQEEIGCDREWVRAQFGDGHVVVVHLEHVLGDALLAHECARKRERKAGARTLSPIRPMLVEAICCSSSGSGFLQPH